MRKELKQLLEQFKEDITETVKYYEEIEECENYFKEIIENLKD